MVLTRKQKKTGAARVTEVVPAARGWMTTDAALNTDQLRNLKKFSLGMKWYLEQLSKVKKKKGINILEELMD